VKSNAEITLESNPDSISDSTLEAYTQAGFNRLSVGVQAWQDNLLKMMGRPYSNQGLKEAFKVISGSNFKNVNVDLIFGYPEQSLEDFKISLSNSLEQGVQHLGVYSLEVEEGTVLHQLLKKGKLLLPSEQLNREMADYAFDFLEQQGLKQYEISNFAIPGFECKYNLDFWKGGEYLGVGAGAVSFLSNKEVQTLSPVSKYIESTKKCVQFRKTITRFTTDQIMERKLILGLRLNEGILVKDDPFYIKKVEKLVKRNLLNEFEGRVKLTKQGKDLLNLVISSIIE
jgi:oxygen-independent coproporphyrinogen-3 oxidase